MNRLLLATVLTVAGAAGLAGSAVAMPAGRAAPATARKPVRAKTCHPQRGMRHRCQPSRRHGTRSTGRRGGTGGSRAPGPAGAGIPTPAAPPPAPAGQSGPSGTSGPAPLPPQRTPVPLPIPGPSAWDRPTLSNPITVQITAANYVIALSQSQDYVLECPPGALQLPAALNVWGGHNVVFENCDLDVTAADWAAHFSYQTGTLWMHDVHFGGPQLTGGMQLQEPGATVVMRDVLFDKVYGSLDTNHAELIQTWAGPGRLMIDGLTGSTTYQGLFLEPDQYDNGPPPSVFDLRHIDIDDTQGAYALWLAAAAGAPPGDASGSILTWNVQDVHVVPNPARTWSGWWLWPKPSTGDPTWANVIAGAPPGGNYVQATPTGASGVDETTSPPALVGEAP